MRRTKALGGGGGGFALALGPARSVDDEDGVLDVEGCGFECLMAYEEADVIAVRRRFVVPEIA